MGLDEAKTILQTAINTKTGEVNSLQLALNIILQLFAPQFNALQIAQNEANQFAADRNKAIQEKEVQEQRADGAEATLVRKQSEIDALNQQLDDCNDQIGALKDQILILTPKEVTDPSPIIVSDVAVDESVIHS